MEPTETEEAIPQKKSRTSRMSTVRERATVQPQKSSRRWRGRTILVVVVTAVLGAGLYAIYMQHKKSDPAYQQQLADAKVRQIVADVGKVLLLPSGMPQIAVVDDSEKLKASEVFFANSKNGDEVLVYPTVAVLYRPSEHKIINVAPVVNNTPQNPAPLRVAYYNGTTVAGLAKSAETIVKNAYPNSQATVLTDATGRDYSQTLVVDLTGSHSKEVSNLASLLHGKVGPLPQREVAPNADILVITAPQ